MVPMSWLCFSVLVLMACEPYSQPVGGCSFFGRSFVLECILWRRLTVVSLSGSAARLPAIHNHCDAGYSGLAHHKQLRERLAGNRWRQVSVLSFKRTENFMRRFCGPTCSIERCFVDFNVYMLMYVFALVCGWSYCCMCTCACVFSTTLRLCNPIGDSSRKRIYSSPVLLHFHSDESLTHKGFYLVYRAFSPESSEHTILLCSPSVYWMYDNVWALFCKVTWLWFVLWSAFVLWLSWMLLFVLWWMLCNVSGPLKVKCTVTIFFVVYQSM